MKGILVIGSNWGDRYRNINSAIAFLMSLCKILHKSDIYESYDFLGSGVKYLNIVIEIETSVDIQIINQECKKYESECGRDAAKRKRGEVPVDIDVVVWNGSISRTKDYEASYFKKGYNQILALTRESIL